MGSLIQLIGYRCVYHCGICEICIIFSGNSNVQCVVGTLICLVNIYIRTQDIACIVCCADTCININSVQCVAQYAKSQVSLYVCMLADSAAVALCDSCYCVAVCVIAKCRNLVVLGPCVEHGHAHTVVIGCNNINLIAKRGRPCADCIACCGSIPCSSCGVLHLLGSKLTDNVCLSANFDGAVLYNRCCTVCVCTNRIAVDAAVFLYRGAESLADTSCTCDRVVMSDVSDCQNVADDSVAVTVN